MRILKELKQYQQLMLLHYRSIQYGILSLQRVNSHYMQQVVTASTDLLGTHACSSRQQQHVATIFHFIFARER